MIEFSNLNYVDWIIFFILLATSIIGFNNGFLKEFLNVFIWILSILFSIFIINRLIYFNLPNSSIIFIILVFIFLFLISFIILKLLIYYFVNDFKYLFNSNYINKIFGSIFGFVKGLFLIALSTSGVIYLFYTTKDFPPILSNSLFFEPIKTYSIKVLEKIVNFI